MSAECKPNLKTLLFFPFVILEVDEANLTWVYVVGGCVGLFIILCIVCIVWRVKNQSKITEEVHESRRSGLQKQWGVRSRSSILLMEAQN